MIEIITRALLHQLQKSLLANLNDALYRRSKLISFKVKNSIQTSSILLRKSKTDQDSIGKWLHLSQRARLALVERLKELPKHQDMLFCGLNRALDLNPQIEAGQVIKDRYGYEVC
jgi:hypothetical protein